MKRGNILLVLLVALLIISAGITVFNKPFPFGGNYYKTIPDSKPKETPLPTNKTANWKTYSDSKYQFSLRYPPEWEAIETGSGLYFKTHRYDPAPELYPSIEVKNNWSAQQEIKSLEPEKCPPSPTTCVQLESGVHDDQPYTLDNRSARRFSNTTQEGVDVQYTVSNLKTTSYILISQTGDRDFDQIISSFKLIDSDSVTWRDALRKSRLRQLATALEMYRADGNSYPKTSGNPSDVLKFLVPKYLVNIPQDPGSRLFYYEYTAEDDRYVLCASTENKPPENSPLTACNNKNCGEICNYEFRSPK